MQLMLKNILDKKGKTAYWLAKETGLTQKTIFNMVHNNTNGIQFDTLEKICSVLNCTPNDILKNDALTHD